MINVKILYKCESIIGFEISGHSGYAEYGKDIICAAVSVLGINTINSIKAFTKDEVEFNYKDDGFLSLNIKSKISDESILLLKSFKLGIDGIIRQYGNNYINIIIKEV